MKTLLTFGLGEGGLTLVKKTTTITATKKKKNRQNKTTTNVSRKIFLKNP